jgi:hypothetical protein
LVLKKYRNIIEEKYWLKSFLLLVNWRKKIPREAKNTRRKQTGRNFREEGKGTNRIGVETTSKNT